MNASNKTQPIKTRTLREVAFHQGPEALQSAIAAFANSCPRAVVDEHGREFYKYPDAGSFLSHLFIYPQAVQALRVTDVDIMRGYGFLYSSEMPTWMSDLHHLTAMALFGRSAGGVSKEERAKAKAHNFRFLYGGGGKIGEAIKRETVTDAQVLDLMAELTGLPKERLRIVDKVHGDYIMGVLPPGRKGDIKVGLPVEIAKHLKANQQPVVAAPMTETDIAQIARRVTQKLDKIKRALSNTTKDVEDIEAYLKDKLDGYRNAR